MFAQRCSLARGQLGITPVLQLPHPTHSQLAFPSLSLRKFLFVLAASAPNESLLIWRARSPPMIHGDDAFYLTPSFPCSLFPPKVDMSALLFASPLPLPPGQKSIIELSHQTELLLRLPTQFRESFNGRISRAFSSAAILLILSGSNTTSMHTFQKLCEPRKC